MGSGKGVAKGTEGSKGAMLERSSQGTCAIAMTIETL